MVQETWIYELSPLNNWNTVDTAQNPKQTKFGEDYYNRNVTVTYTKQ